MVFHFYSVSTMRDLPHEVMLRINGCNIHSCTYAEGYIPESAIYTISVVGQLSTFAGKTVSRIELVTSEGDVVCSKDLTYVREWRDKITISKSTIFQIFWTVQEAAHASTD